jgi:hypothetical protein
MCLFGHFAFVSLSQFPENPPVVPVDADLEANVVEVDDLGEEEEEEDYFFPVRLISEAEIVSATQPVPEAAKGTRKTILDEI